MNGPIDQALRRKSQACETKLPGIARCLECQRAVGQTDWNNCENATCPDVLIFKFRPFEQP